MYAYPLRWLWWSLLAVGVAATPAGAEHRWQYGAAYSYSSGDYGSDETTSFHYVPLGVKRFCTWGDVSLTVPYVRVVTDGGAAIVQGEVVPTGTGEESDESGLGDMLAKVRYFALEEQGNRPYIDLALRLRLPTADEDKGLGSGEPDLTFFAEFTRTAGDAGFVLSELGYTVVADSLEVELENRFLYSLGYAHRVHEKVQFSGYLDGRTAVASGASDPLSLLLLSELRLSADLRFDIMLEFGLSDGSPDAGMMFGVRYRSDNLPRPDAW